MNPACYRHLLVAKIYVHFSHRGIAIRAAKIGEQRKGGNGKTQLKEGGEDQKKGSILKRKMYGGEDLGNGVREIEGDLTWGFAGFEEIEEN